MPRFAALDLGSNALRLRIAEAVGPIVLADANGEGPPSSGSSGGGFSEVVSLRVPIRLGSDVFATGSLSTSSINQACAALREFRKAMDTARIDSYRAVATAAARDADNAGVLIERARREAGIELEVIEGIEEARLIQLAMTRRIRLDGCRAMLVDVGGGSSEFTLLENGKVVFSTSLPLGTVRLLDSYLRTSTAPTRRQVRLVDETVDRALAELKQPLGDATIGAFVGSGGNVDTLAELCPMTGGYGTFGRAIDLAALKQFSQKAAALSADERQKAFGLRADRADTILPASRIFVRASEVFKVPAIVAPGVGLKEGILLELADKHFHTWDATGASESVLEACVRLGRRYRFDEAHGERVATFAGQLFDATAAQHSYGPRERLLLRAASWLHDVGDFVRYDGHHKHSYYIIQNSDLVGLTAPERTVVANVARYHRKSPPAVDHPNFRSLDKDDRAKVRVLAALLRIADALDREHLGKVQRIQALVQGSKLLLELSGSADRELEEWTVLAKADLLREALGLVPEIRDDGTGKSGPSSQRPSA